MHLSRSRSPSDEEAPSWRAKRRDPWDQAPADCQSLAEVVGPASRRLRWLSQRSLNSTEPRFRPKPRLSDCCPVNRSPTATDEIPVKSDTRLCACCGSTDIDPLRGSVGHGWFLCRDCGGLEINADFEIDGRMVGETDLVCAVHGKTLGSDDGDLSDADIDVWAMRDAGYVDPEGLRILRERLGVADELVLDYTDEPDPHQKQRVIEHYDQIAAYLNAEKLDGRTDWTPRQAWGLGRAATAKQYGADPAETLFPVPWGRDTESEDKQEWTISVELLADGTARPVAHRTVSDDEIEAMRATGELEDEEEDHESPSPLNAALVAGGRDASPVPGDQVDLLRLRRVDGENLRTVRTMVEIGFRLDESAADLSVDKRHGSSTGYWSPPPPPGEEWIDVFNTAPMSWRESDWARVEKAVMDVGELLGCSFVTERLSEPLPEPLGEDDE